ncbi:acyltransferase [Ferruginibacter sp. HRS2-29]|uniref:acyltransferase family protein n=1 Tax=Ferruginibacter sp. HRS2-29 TaxID=2487334 RepID=UPI0020CB8F23|nr:acyltransferase [Ferruginibacter sp. HRS2-29]MCP9752229.1 acyltransferase [Ferruginibacter sp. HRS2-29]
MLSSSSAFTDSKKHFVILDALRGVAAIVVVLFHILELYSGGDHTKQVINHGYLAVDFFFMLSGYVMAHAYDDRWDKMTAKDFLKRRVIRLHPLIIAGMILGAICFYFSESAVFPNVAQTPVWKLLLVTLVGCTLLPLPVSMDIRGWTEMHPLNGPAWSLFFEYIANLLHVFILRKLSKLMLGLLAFMAGAALIHLAVTHGDIIGGWSLEPAQLRIGFTRLLFPYIAGMLLRRLVKPEGGKNTFLWCALLLVAVMSFPRVGGHEKLWANGLFDSFSIILIFPAIIYLGATGEVKNKLAKRLCTFLGDISYPLYILHFPFTYVFYGWVSNNNIPMKQGVLVGIGLLIFCVALSYAILKYYDEPVRKWLAKRSMKKI